MLTSASVMVNYLLVLLVRNPEGLVNALVPMINLRRERKEGLTSQFLL